MVESEEAQPVEAELIEDEASRPSPSSTVATAGASSAPTRTASPIVQHAGKGPLYRLTPDPFMSTLTRLPPDTQRKIVARERAGVRSYALVWGIMTMVARKCRCAQRPAKAPKPLPARGSPATTLTHYGCIGFQHG